MVKFCLLLCKWFSKIFDEMRVEGYYMSMGALLAGHRWSRYLARVIFAGYEQFLTRIV